MPLIPASAPQVVEDQMRRLRERAAHHKAEVRRHKEALRQAMAQLASLESFVRRQAAPPPGEG